MARTENPVHLYENSLEWISKSIILITIDPGSYVASGKGPVLAEAQKGG